MAATLGGQSQEGVRLPLRTREGKPGRERVEAIAMLVITVGAVAALIGYAIIWDAPLWIRLGVLLASLP